MQIMNGELLEQDLDALLKKWHKRRKDWFEYGSDSEFNYHDVGKIKATVLNGCIEELIRVLSWREVNDKGE